ncbi:phosphotransferase family protein [Oceanicola sp. 502str15]|uniref:phosphotransferase family protein n=1 Tax=Oceanicola sp. 502str15 TaxID=2696061 RepID=UPI00209466CC|nr:phosphotransferase family protein [Oceanicola sp. 502str15]MCO6381552.1 phosphotransferase [Oceanicola sp. 502str15]
MTAQTLDTAAVAAWINAHAPGHTGPVTAEKFATGQSNPTFRLTTPQGSLVLRRKPPGKLLKSAHAVDREFRVQSALAATPVPVARMIAYCDDPAVIGSEFYLMEHIEGRHFNQPHLPKLSASDRAPIFDEMNRVLAAIHEVDLAATGLADYGRAGNYYRRQIDRWTTQYRASETETIQAMDALIAWLDANVPEDDGQVCLTHGDYRLDNMLFAPDAPRITAVLDWELSTLGHPYADLAQVIMQWQRPPGPEGRGLAGLERAAHGLPTDDAFIESYCTRRGLPGIPAFGFYLAFANFRMAGILQGVKKRALDGNASNPEKGLQLGALVPGLAEAGLEAAADA